MPRKKEKARRAALYSNEASRDIANASYNEFAAENAASARAQNQMFTAPGSRSAQQKNHSQE